MNLTHKNGVASIITKLKEQGLTRCKKEVQQGDRRLDGQCKNKKVTVNFEVKNNLKDFKSPRSQKQIAAMTNNSNKNNQAMIVHIVSKNCIVPMNKLGKKFIQENGIRLCRVPKRI